MRKHLFNVPQKCFASFNTKLILVEIVILDVTGFCMSRQIIRIRLDICNPDRNSDLHFKAGRFRRVFEWFASHLALTIQKPVRFSYWLNYWHNLDK